jgi:thimet oligopeptidase
MFRVASAFAVALLLAVAPAAQQPAIAQADARALTQTSPDAPFTSGGTDAAALQGAVERRLARVQQLLDDLLRVTGSRTVANTLQPYDEILNELQTAGAYASLIAAVHPDDAARKAGSDLERRLAAAESEFQLKPEVFRALEAIRLDGLDTDTRYYLTRTLNELRRLGVDRPEAARARIAKLREELTGLMDEFQRNIRDRGRRFTVASARDLDGLPADFIARHPADASGAITLTSDNVDTRMVLTYAANDALRKRMYVESFTVAYPENLAVLDKILAVRWELARLLGYPNWASYDTASRMSGDVKTVSAFIDRVVAASDRKAAREHAELLALKRQKEPGSSLSVWDRPYYAEQIRRRNYDFDSQALRPYFAFDRVLQGALDLTARIFAVTYRPVADVPVWHPSVRVYEMLDSGRVLGRVYLDLHRRPNKSANLAVTTTVQQGAAGKHIPEVVLRVSLPGGQPGDPGLMTHDDVRTLFHEFGHVVHRVIGGHRAWYGLSSLQLERDFTEAPSQMLEEWIWDPATLATFATHYQTNEPIPARLVLQMRRASEFGQALDVRGQMVFARSALSYHDRDPKRVDTTAIWKEAHNRYLPYAHVDGTYRQAVFPHLAQGGYQSAYYTYMWSLVIAKDMLTGFDARNLSASGAARRYRDTVFASGSAKPASALVRDFLGRPFNATAWESWLNRETPAVSTN